MPATITLSHLTWSTPEGRPLFSDCNLTFGAERAGLVGRNGVGKTTLLKLIAGALQPQAGTVTVSGTIGLLRQSLSAAAGESVADLFGVRAALALLQRAERGDATAEDLADADWTLEARLEQALGAVGLYTDPATPLSALSGGQQTRAALAALIFDEPDFLLLDEPSHGLAPKIVDELHDTFLAADYSHPGDNIPPVLAVAQHVVLKGLSVRETEELVRRRQNAKPAAKPGVGVAKIENSDVTRLSERLADTLGAEVKVAANKRGAGKITISFQSLDQLDGLIERFFD